MEEVLDEPVPEDCHMEPSADYDGPALSWGLEYKLPSAARCCQACKDVRRGAGSRRGQRVPKTCGRAGSGRAADGACVPARPLAPKCLHAGRALARGPPVHDVGLVWRPLWHVLGPRCVAWGVRSMTRRSHADIKHTAVPLAPPAGTADIWNHTTGECWLKFQPEWDRNPDLKVGRGGRGGWHPAHQSLRLTLPHGRAPCSPGHKSGGQR